MLSRRQLQGVDRVFLSATLLLLGIGLLVLYSAALQKFQTTGVNFVQRQLMWTAIGCALAVVLILVDYHRWLEWAYVLYALSLILLLAVLVIGTVRGGAQRWLSIGGLTIQPSEFAKITTIMALGRFLGSRRQPGQGRWTTALLGCGIVLLPAVLILKEPNLGTATVFAVLGVTMLVIWGLPLKVIGFILLAGAVAAPIGWSFLAEYQRSRLMVFMNPNLDPLGAGYTVIQSKIAMGSGQWIGKGWLSGTQNQLNFLPERHTDFIFSVVGEEWGLLGTTFCLGLLMLLFHRGLVIAEQTRDPFGRLMVVGLVTMLAFHTLVNTGMVLGMAPVVGLPLPFMSYGGSWLMTCLVASGIILSVGVRRPVF
ncbi:MAG: rod shape-determining protein RodA [Candidatus Omnitrophica bacterium]|nr:rod shape-determining protein RodA [Candidatus Omnitrophota bacterium]